MKLIFAVSSGLLVVAAFHFHLYELLGAALIGALASLDFMINEDK